MKRIKQSSIVKDTKGHRSCSILIPKKYEGILKKSVKKHGSLRLTLSYLINNYIEKIDHIDCPTSSHYTIKYQEEKQNLIKHNFYPNESDWIKLKLLATIKGISIAYLVTIFLWVDSVIGQNIIFNITGIHEKIPSITLLQKLTPFPNPTITRKIKLRI